MADPFVNLEDSDKPPRPSELRVSPDPTQHPPPALTHQQTISISPHARSRGQQPDSDRWQQPLTFPIDRPPTSSTQKPRFPPTPHPAPLRELSSFNFGQPPSIEDRQTHPPLALRFSSTDHGQPQHASLGSSTLVGQQPPVTSSVSELEWNLRQAAGVPNAMMARPAVNPDSFSPGDSDSSQPPPPLVTGSMLPIQLFCCPYTTSFPSAEYLASMEPRHRLPRITVNYTIHHLRRPPSAVHAQLAHDDFCYWSGLSPATADHSHPQPQTPLYTLVELIRYASDQELRDLRSRAPDANYRYFTAVSGDDSERGFVQVPYQSHVRSGRAALGAERLAWLDLVGSFLLHCDVHGQMWEVNLLGDRPCGREG